MKFIIQKNPDFYLFFIFYKNTGSQGLELIALINVFINSQEYIKKDLERNSEVHSRDFE